MSEAIEEKSLGAFNARKAMLHLIETAGPHMSTTQLELMARATEAAKLQAENMADILESVGILIDNDDKDASGFKDWRGPVLLYQIANQFDLIAGLIELGDNAKFYLKRKEVQHDR